MRYLNLVLLLAQKDLQQEFRQPINTLSTLVFCGLLVFILSLAQTQAESNFQLASTLIWVILLFASLFAMHQSFSKEQENSCLDALCLAFPEKSALFLGKAVANFVVMLILSVLVIGACFIFWDLGPITKLGLFLCTVLLGIIGLSFIGTLFNGITWQTEANSVLLPVLSFPIAIPLLIAVVELTRTSLGLSSVIQPWLYFLIFFNLLFLFLSVILFDVILEV